MAGFSRDEIKRVSGHKSDKVVDKYVDNSDFAKRTASNVLSMSGSSSSIPLSLSRSDGNRNQLNITNNFSINVKGSSKVKNMTINAGKDQEADAKRQRLL